MVKAIKTVVPATTPKCVKSGLSLYLHYGYQVNGDYATVMECNVRQLPNEDEFRKQVEVYNFENHIAEEFNPAEYGYPVMEE